MTGAGVIRQNHVGLSVADLDAALAFCEAFLGVPAKWQRLLDRPYLGRIVGYPGVVIRAAHIGLPDGTTLELMEYQVPDRARMPEASSCIGHIHLCFNVEDADAAFALGVALGARPVTPDGPVEIDAGPNTGAKAAYLRIHDGITLELLHALP